jgi:hypothetical protein
VKTAPTGGSTVAYGIVLEFTDIDRKQYDAVNAQLGLDMETGTGAWPAGLLSHAAGPLPGGWIVSEVWESASAQESFMAGRLGTALAAVGVPAPTRVTDSELVAYRTA